MLQTGAKAAFLPREKVGAYKQSEANPRVEVTIMSPLRKHSKKLVEDFVLLVVEKVGGWLGSPTMPPQPFLLILMTLFCTPGHVEGLLLFP